MKPIYIGINEGKFRSVSLNEEGAKRDCDQVMELHQFELEMIVGLFMGQDRNIKLYKTNNKHSWSDYTFKNKAGHE